MSELQHFHMHVRTDPPTPWKSQILVLLTLSKKRKKKKEFAGDWVCVWALLTPLEKIEQCTFSALYPQIMFLLSVYLQRNISKEARLLCLHFSGLHNARLVAERWTDLTSGIMWQILLWFNCCLERIGGWVWHNNISKNNGHLVYIAFLPVISEQISGLL